MDEAAVSNQQPGAGGQPVVHIPADLAGEAESPPVLPGEAPGPEGKLSLVQHLAISSFWFANNLHWGALLMIVLPSEATRLAPTIGMAKAEISGLTVGLGAIVGAFVPPIVGAFSDRCTLPMGRRRPFVIAGVLINLLALALFYLAFQAKSLPGYVGAWLLINLGNNIATGAFSGIIPDVVPKSERGLASGWMAAMQQVGMIGGFIAGGFLMAQRPEKDLEAILIIAVALAVISTFTVLLTRERPLARAEPIRWSDLKHCFWVDPRKHPDFAWVWVQRALFTLGWNLIQANLLYFMVDVVRAKAPEASFAGLAIIVLVGAIPTGLLGGVLSDRWGRKRIICIAGLVMAVTSLLFAAVGYMPDEWRLWAVYAFGVLWGFGYGAYLSVDWALGTDVLPNPDDAGKDMGVWHLSMTIPQSIAAPAAALLLKPFVLPGGESYRTPGYTLLFGVACFFMFLCAILIFQVKKAR
jgi:MFS family permease